MFLSIIKENNALLNWLSLPFFSCIGMYQVSTWKVTDWPRPWPFLYPPSLFIQSMDLVSLSHWFFMGRLKRNFLGLFIWITRCFFSCPHEQHKKTHLGATFALTLLRLKLWEAYPSDSDSDSDSEYLIDPGGKFFSFQCSVQRRNGNKR